MKSRILLFFLRKSFSLSCCFSLAWGGIMLSIPAAAQLKADFTANTTTGCSPVIVQFTDHSQGSPGSWKWDFGNGSNSVLQNPQASYALPGTYTVMLTVSNSSGSNTVVKTAYITVYPAPVVSFAQSPAGGCNPLPVTFTNQSTTSSGNIISQLWDFGDGNTDSSQNPSHTYISPGNFNVSLVVTNNYGCKNAQTKFNAVSVSGGVQADFSSSGTTACTAPFTVSFTNTSSGSGTLNYLWDFGDGSTSTQASPQHTYNNTGSYTVSLKVSNAAGCSSIRQKTNLVNIADFRSGFQAPNGCVNVPVHFINTSSPSPSAATWYFSDGAVINGINAVRSFSTAGTYTVKLVNAFGNCTDSVTQSFTVADNPVADFTSGDTVNCSTPFTAPFRDLSSASSGWLWDFGDGTGSSAQNPAHNYTASGSYPVKLLVTNAAGCKDSVVKNNFIRIQAPVARFTTDISRGCAPLTVHFTPQINSVDSVTSYRWDFGDGGSSALARPAYTYFQEGIYTVKLIITTATGCTDTVVVPGAVRAGTKPVANFAATPLTTCQMHPVYFTDSSSKADQWFWNFGDSTFSQLQNPEHFYGAVGRFDVKLIVGNKGCRDTLTKPNYINILPPIAGIGVNRNCTDHYQVSFFDKSTGALHWLWNFGDSTSAAVQNPPPHIYKAPGTYTVILRVDNDSCFSFDTVTVAIVDEQPVIKADTNTVCRGTAVNFTAGNIHPPNIVSYQWEPGDGSTVTDTVRSFSKTYTANGLYLARLIIRDINGCVDSSNVDTIIVKGPVADFNAQQRNVCPNTSVPFTDLSASDGRDSIIQWIWNFGDGTGDTLSAPPFLHSYAAGNQYNVQLTVKDQGGCSAGVTKPNYITVHTAVAGFFAPDTLVCPGAAVNFISTSRGNNLTYLWDFGDSTGSSQTNPNKVYTKDGAYTVKLAVTTAEGCKDSVTRVNYIRAATPKASFNFQSNNANCPPYIVKLTNTSTNYRNILWDFGDGSTSGLDTPGHIYNVPGNYTIRLLVTGYSGCQDSVIKTITVSGPTGTQSYQPTSGCNPLAVQFNAIAQNTVKYTWDFGDGVISPPSPNDTISHTYITAGTYHPQLIVEDAHGCQVTVPNSDSLIIDGLKAKFATDFSMVCRADSVRFINNSRSYSGDTLGMATTWLWNFGDTGQAGNTSRSQNPGYRFSKPGNYQVVLQATSVYGCISRDSAQVNIPGPFTMTASGDTAICAGQTVRLDAAGASAFNWVPAAGLSNPAISNPMATPDSTTTYTVTGHDSLNCYADTARVTVTVNPLPKVGTSGDQTVTVGSTVQLQGNGSNDITGWQWSPPDYLSCTNCADPVSNPREPITYKVVASNQNGCVSIAYVTINLICSKGVVFIPNTFTPNGDGANDIFYPRGRGVRTIHYFRIFNRWGQLVFERDNFNIDDKGYGWNGTFNGKKLSPDVYVYIAEMVCDTGEVFQVKGNVTLLR